MQSAQKSIASEPDTKFEPEAAAPVENISLVSLQVSDLTPDITAYDADCSKVEGAGNKKETEEPEDSTAN